MRTQVKADIMITPVSITNGGTASGYIDTLDYEEIWIALTQGTTNTTSNNLSLCSITEGETTVISDASAITALTGDGVGGFTIPAGNTSDPQVYLFHINKSRGPRKRYLFLACSPLTTQIIGATALMMRGKSSPVTAANSGASLLVEL
jgi:hypothetical protein